MLNTPTTITFEFCTCYSPIRSNYKRCAAIIGRYLLRVVKGPIGHARDRGLNRDRKRATASACSRPNILDYLTPRSKLTCSRWGAPRYNKVVSRMSHPRINGGGVAMCGGDAPREQNKQHQAFHSHILHRDLSVRNNQFLALGARWINS